MSLPASNDESFKGSMAEIADHSHVKQQDLEDYLLLILSDSALPTGGFVASSGLESFLQHGFITSTSAAQTEPDTSLNFTLLSFLRESLTSYAHLNLPFFDKAHQAVWHLHSINNDSNDVSHDITLGLQSLIQIDNNLEAMLLNHVTRRASKAQGMALLTLYSRAFASLGKDAEKATISQRSVNTLMEDLKAACRGKKATFHGHLPTCFAALCAALGLSLDRSRHLHLFLQARAILSSAVRLNLVGPYAAQRVLLVDVRNTVNTVLHAEERLRRSNSSSPNQRSTQTRWHDNHEEEEEDEDESGPATTWPLGEILAARHDQLHSRIFNS